MMELVFGNKSFDAILCLNAELPGEQFFHIFKGLPILAADGAAIFLDKISLYADYVIGDMDSFDASSVKYKYAEKQLIRISDQDSNDFEKALRFALRKNYHSILIVGMQGGELEHTLNNWSVLARYGKNLQLCTYDNLRYGIPIYKSTKFSTSPGEIISIIPQHKIKLKTNGLKWDLKGEELGFGSREGARNKAVTDRVELEIIDGSAILFMNSRLPHAPHFI